MIGKWILETIVHDSAKGKVYGIEIRVRLGRTHEKSKNYNHQTNKVSEKPIKVQVNGTI